MLQLPNYRYCVEEDSVPGGKCIINTFDGGRINHKRLPPRPEISKQVAVFIPKKEESYPSRNVYFSDNAEEAASTCSTDSKTLQYEVDEGVNGVSVLLSSIKKGVDGPKKRVVIDNLTAEQIGEAIGGAIGDAFLPGIGQVVGKLIGSMIASLINSGYKKLFVRVSAPDPGPGPGPGPEPGPVPPDPDEDRPWAEIIGGVILGILGIVALGVVGVLKGKQ